jgi:hypothetical protein
MHYFYVFNVHFLKFCNFVNLIFKPNIYVSSSRFKECSIQKMIYHFIKNMLKIKIYFLLVYGSIVLKTDDSHLFEEVIIFLFHV